MHSHFKHIVPNDGNVTCCRTLRMPVCYKLAAIGQSLIDDQEVHKVKLSPKSGKHDHVGRECGDLFTL